MEIRKTEIYETENFMVEHKDGCWRIQLGKCHVIKWIEFGDAYFEELAEIIRIIKDL
jgi:hypothetical protein